MNRTLSKWIITIIVQSSIFTLMYIFWGVLNILFYGYASPTCVDAFIFVLLFIPWNAYIIKWINKVVRDHD